MKAARLARGPADEARLTDAREDERRKLARELHDGPAQSMAAALFGIDLAIASLGQGTAAARDELVHARALMREALDDLRALMIGLRPRLLEERGLVSALCAMAETPPLWGPEIIIEALGMEEGRRLPPDVELALYRIAQEAVSNARQHGGASRVQVELACRTGEAALEIVDDGRGFPPQRIRPEPGRGEGLPGMRERAALLGGTLTINSAPGAGTRVSVSVPLPEPRTR